MRVWTPAKRQTPSTVTEGSLRNGLGPLRRTVSTVTVGTTRGTTKESTRHPVLFKDTYSDLVLDHEVPVRRCLSSDGRESHHSSPSLPYKLRSCGHSLRTKVRVGCVSRSVTVGWGLCAQTPSDSFCLWRSSAYDKGLHIRSVGTFPPVPWPHGRLQGSEGRRFVRVPF